MQLTRRGARGPSRDDASGSGARHGSTSAHESRAVACDDERSADRCASQATDSREKIPTEGGHPSGQYRQRSSTDFSTPANRSTERKAGGFPIDFHSCGRKGGSSESAANRPLLPCFDGLVCSPLRGSRGRGRRRVEHQIELTAESLWGEVADRLKGALNDT